MTETAKNAQQQIREQFKVAESTLLNSYRAWNDMLSATFDLTVDLAQQNLRYTQETRGQLERLAQDTLANYRSIQETNMKAWQGYVQGVSEILKRAE